MVNDHERHLFKLLFEAGEKLRAFQMYEIGAGHGHVTEAINRKVTTALATVFDAQRDMELRVKVAGNTEA